MNQLLEVIENEKNNRFKNSWIKLDKGSKLNRLQIYIDKQKISKLDIFDFPELEKIADIMLCIGGDGTFLSTARRIGLNRNIPLLGIHIGGLGFLAEISKDKTYSQPFVPFTGYTSKIKPNDNISFVLSQFLLIISYMENLLCLFF